VGLEGQSKVVLPSKETRNKKHAQNTH